ncbi:unnamed protein product [Rotaria sordida]|uniref:Uncharacterized protein n=2 Tax=Rotaria sordida TaxID=392033 RepID=A0A819ETE3_9BILA|nr:unnamed protein product [Rotaria sordida]CAF3855965.1 unnamed protein product [Rotaria sordida]
MDIEQSVIDMYEEFMNNISNDINVQSASSVSMEQNLNNTIENRNDHSDGSTNGATNINGNHSNCVNRNDIANHNDSLNPNNNETNHHSLNHNINANISGNINNSINQNNNSNTNNIINRDQNEETAEDIVEIINIQNNVHVKVLRDYGITVGNTNSNMWSRRELHVAQDDVHIKLTLWNDQAKRISGTIINKYLKLKNVKIDWFNGSRTLISMPNTRVAIV